MSYFGFLLRFLLLPALVLGALLYLERRAGRRRPDALSRRPAWLALLIHVLLAVGYTTPWDNYLVATRVWWYDPQRVTGLTLGWVPIEEYTFFVLQTLFTGSWLLWAAGRARVDPTPAPYRPRLRWLAFSVLALLWLGAAAILVAGWQPGTYLALELIWLVPPMFPQVLVGAEVLWHQRRLVAPALLVPTIYLAAADALAINSGVWTINPEQTTGILVGGVLPLEEMIFFALTNTLIVFGMTLFMSLSVPQLRLTLPWRSRRERQARSQSTMSRLQGEDG